MAGRIAAGAEIARRPHQTFAEKVSPDPIDEHPRGQRIVAIDDRLGKFQPATAVLERLAVFARQDSQKPPRRLLALRARITANEDMNIVRLRRINKAKRRRRVLWFHGTVKHAIERVIILRGNRIVLVIVASRAADCESHCAPANHVDAIVVDVRRGIQEPPAERQEPHRGIGRTQLRPGAWSPAICATINRSYGRSSLKARITQSR